MQAKSPMPTLAIDVGNDVGPKKPRYTSIGRARNPPANCVVNMQTPTFSIISQTRQRWFCSVMSWVGID